MTRLEILKEEKKIIENMKCLSFELIERCQQWYDNEIRCIEGAGCDNSTKMVSSNEPESVGG